MKYIFILMFFLISVASADVLSDKLENLKNLTVVLNPAAVPEQTFAEEDIDGDYLYEVFDYMQKMHAKYPDRMDKLRKEYLISCLESLENTMNHADSADTDYARQTIHTIAVEKLQNMVDEILLIPNEANEAEVFNWFYPDEKNAKYRDQGMDEALFMHDTEYYCNTNILKTVSRGMTGTVIVTAANVRNGPSTDYPVITVVYKDQKFKVLEKGTSWHYIELADGKKGYIHYRLLEIEEVPDLTGTILVTAANMRKGPSTSYEVITVLKKGEILIILDADSDWYLVKTADDTEGYVYHTLVSLNYNQPSSLADAIVDSAEGAVGQSDIIYGVDCYTEITEWGNLACAIVVSTILRHAGCDNDLHISCVLLRNHLRYDLGWKELDNENYLPGDVCFWRIRMDDRPRHVGVIVQKDIYSKWWAVDNSSSEKVVLKRPLLRSYYPYVHPVTRAK